MLCVKERGKAPLESIGCRDLWGKREAKYGALENLAIEATTWQSVEPVPEFYSFVPTAHDLRKEYESGWKITDAMPVNVLGFQTHRDDFAVAFDEPTMRSRISELRSLNVSDDDIRSRYGLSEHDQWRLETARARLRSQEKWEHSIVPCLYRPIDTRWCYLNDLVMDRPRPLLIEQVARRENLCLGLGRQGLAVADSEWYLMTISRFPIDANVFRRGGVNIFPAYLYQDSVAQASLALGTDRMPNFSAPFLQALCQKLELRTERPFGFPAGITPEQVIQYSYACFHSPSYRRRYAEFLATDFPRIPLTSDRELFAALSAKGAELIALHLMESPKLNEFITSYPEKGGNEVEKVWYEDESTSSAELRSAGRVRAPVPTRPQAPAPTRPRVWINKTQYFEGVPREVWEFRIGGYQVCEKWLKDRKGRELAYDDLQHYQEIIVALSETRRLMAEIDALIPGWPLP